MRTVERRTSLEWALIGELDQGPQSGYDLRKSFSATPLVHFSDSPGAIYPALRRLERHGLIEAVPGPPQGGRRRRPVRLTALGKRTFVAWLRTPPTRDEVERDMDGLILRLAFMSQALPTETVRGFLDALADPLAEHLRGLETFFAQAGPAMPLSARLAFESGIATFRAYDGWLARARRVTRRSSNRRRREE